jgi:hypothetical protein
MLGGMETDPAQHTRESRELSRAGRWSGKSWGGNRPSQWAVLGLFALALAVIAVVLVLVA